MIMMMMSYGPKIEESKELDQKKKKKNRHTHTRRSLHLVLQILLSVSALFNPKWA